MFTVNKIQHQIKYPLVQYKKQKSVTYYAYKNESSTKLFKLCTAKYCESDRYFNFGKDQDSYKS